MTSHGSITTNTGTATVTASTGEQSVQAHVDALAGSAISMDAPTAAVTSGPFQHAAATPARADGERAAVRHLIFWRDGFELGRGTLLRRYDDPAQAAILAEINAGGVPPTALGVQPGELVELRVEKRFDRDYAPGEEIEVPGAEEGALPTVPQITTGGKAKGLVEGAVREIVLWKNGFQLGPGGALRRYDDPVQAALLADINQGKAPPELGMSPGQPVELRVSNRTGEDFVSDSKETHALPPIKEKSSAVVEPNRLGPEKGTKSESIQPTKEGRELSEGAQEEKSNLFDKIVGCIRFCL